MGDATVRTILIPGAWMGTWVWEPVAQILSDLGRSVEMLTLPGLEPGLSDSRRAAVRLEQHVQALLDHIAGSGTGSVVLVSHSYSAMPAAIAADRLGERVRRLVHIGGFLPVDGRSLLDDWGDSAAAREQEREDIAAAGGLWLPPERWMLDHESDLTDRDRDFLANLLTPHPGHTITDHARLVSPVSAQPATYVALAQTGDQTEAWKHAPRVARDASRWRKRHLRSGHWPMISLPDSTAALIAEEIAFATDRES